VNGVVAGEDGRVAGALATYELDAFVATSPESVRYLSGVDFYHHRVAPTELTVVIWPRAGEPSLLAPDWTASFARQRARIALEAWDWRDSPIASLASALRKLGLDGLRLGIELDHLTAGFWEELNRALPEAELVRADRALAAMRLHKTAAEIEALARAAAAAERAIALGFAGARPGVTERELAAAIRRSAFELGADDVAWLFLSSGERNRDGGTPTDRSIGPGELLRIDLGVVIDGYHGDLARTAAAAPAGQRERDGYENLWEIHESALELFEPGRTVGEIAGYVEAEIGRRGLRALDSYIGHSVGLGVHEPPRVEPGEPTQLEPGMVFCLEPAVEDEDGLLHVEDMVLVTEHGPRVLSLGADWSRLPELGTAA
jgi:Xaa-Pro aminopeptidase